MKTLKHALTLLLIIFLFYQTSNGQDYTPYIGLHVRGDIISIDTAVVLDVRLYRSIRSYNATKDEAITSKISLINALEKQVAYSDSLGAVLRSRIEMMESTAARKDSVISDLNGSYRNLVNLNAQALFMLETSLNRKDPIFKDPFFWIGIGAGAVSGILLMR